MDAQYDEANLYLAACLANYKALDNDFGVAMCYNHYGKLHHSRFEYDKAVKYYQQAIPLHRLVSNAHGLGYAFVGLAAAFAQLGQYKDAAKAYQDALAVRQQLEDVYGISFVLASLGYVESNLQQYELANCHFQEAMALAVSIDAPGLVVQILREAINCIAHMHGMDLSAAVMGLLLHHKAFPENEKDTILDCDLPSYEPEQQAYMQDKDQAMCQFESSTSKLAAFFGIEETVLKSLTESCGY